MKKQLLIIGVLTILFCNPLYSKAQKLITIAGNGINGNAGDSGPATAAELSTPTCTAIDGYGNVFIADAHNGLVRKINSSGIISTFSNGHVTIAVALDERSNLYISDQGSNDIRKVTAISGIISTVAGGMGLGYSGDGGPATLAQLDEPGAITVDHTGNIYIADIGNNCIRKVDTSGIITTIAGNGHVTGGYSGDGGPATAALLNGPYGMAIDTKGNLYISDVNNKRIRMVDTSGLIKTFAGIGSGGYSGDGAAATAAEIGVPLGIFVTANGNLYIADGNNNVIRMISTSGVISTVAGPDNIGVPQSVSLDSLGNIFIADQRNNRILEASYSGLSASTPQIIALAVKAYPNPNTGSFTLQLPQTNNAAIITITDLLGSVIKTRTIQNTQPQTVNFNLHAPPGTYIVKVTTGENTYREKIVVW